MSAKVEIPAEYNHPVIASAAGSSNFKRIDGYLVCEDVLQTALDSALSSYDHNAEVEQDAAAAERKWRNKELKRSDIEVFKSEDVLGIFDAEP